eukprot:COSAG02_NODE_2109_length_9808_cov_4.669379_9_plen_124_part_00
MQQGGKQRLSHEGDGASVRAVYTLNCVSGTSAAKLSFVRHALSLHAIATLLEQTSWNEVSANATSVARGRCSARPVAAPCSRSARSTPRPAAIAFRPGASSQPIQLPGADSLLQHTPTPLARS